MFKMRWITVLAIFALVAAVIVPGVAWASPPAHEAPKGSEWVMADWMFLSFVVFAGVSFMAFLMALKSGWLSNLEEAKYPMLEIEEEDYYSPDWASEGGDQ